MEGVAIKYLKANNIKALEKQRDSLFLILYNKYERNGESVFKINEDAYNIIISLDGSKSESDIANIMCKGDHKLFDQARENLNEFLNLLTDSYGVEIEYLDAPDPIEIRILGDGNNQYPSVVSVEITHRCNAKCLHCYGSYSSCNKREDNTTLILKFLEEAKLAGVRIIEFTGGEVTCHPDFLEILNKAYSLNFDLVSILSNGINWGNDLLDLLERNKDKTVVQIDLHGDNDEYLNWFMCLSLENITGIIKNNILKIHKLGVAMRVVTIITPKNINQVENIAEWLYKNNIDIYGLSPVIPVGRADRFDKNNLLFSNPEDINKLNQTILNINKKYGEGFLYQIRDGVYNEKNCGALTRNPSIKPDGTIKFCAMDDGSSIKSVGNVFKTGIGEIYNNNLEFLNIVKNIKAPNFLSEECSDCKNKYFCSYCIIRALEGAKEVGIENCKWYKNNIKTNLI